MNINRSQSIRHASPRAFTLIELLTVIAIIGILVMILIPTIAAARSAAQKSVCASNLRQISIAVLAYANEHKGMLPGARDSSGNWLAMNRAIRNPFTNTVNFDSSTSVESSTQLSTHIADYLGTDKDQSVWRCPSADEAISVSTSNGASPANETTYLLNHRASGSGTDRYLPFGGSKLAPARLNQILAAGSTGYTSDGRAYSSITSHSQIWMITDLDSTNYNYGSFSGAGVEMAHKSGRNYAFFDGHVEYCTSKELPANP